MSDVPLIYSHNHALPPLSVPARLIAALVSASCIAVLIIAARLHPEPSGLKTHLQLGLAPCGMLRSTGLPCIACGMTTSFAHLAQGELVRSLVVQPAGTVLALLAAMGFWTGAYIAATGRPSARLASQFPLRGGFLGLLAIVLLAWGYKIVVVMGARS